MQEESGETEGHTERPASPDFMAMSSSELLNYMDDDAARWAEAFCAIAAIKGHPGIDEGWMIGWFANAIEHSSDVRRWRGQPDVNPVAGGFP